MTRTSLLRRCGRRERGMGLGMVRSGFDEGISDGLREATMARGYIHALTFGLRVMSFMTLQTTNR